MIPGYLRPLFPEIDMEAFEPGKYPEYTITRILERGNRRAVNWLRETFSAAQIADVIRKERRLSHRSANFWALVYGIPVAEVAALRHPDFEKAWRGLS